jgi:hypothetical protein
MYGGGLWLVVQMRFSLLHVKVGTVTHPDKIYMNFTNIHRNIMSHLLCHIMFSLPGE